jgi:3-oxoacyl-[acyl-carrier-protein] synthase-3
MHFLKMMDFESAPEFMLATQVETNTKRLNFSDRSSAILFGDGAAAAIVSKKIPSRMKIIASVLESEPAGWEHVQIPESGHFKQSGNTVQTFAVKKTIMTVEKLRPYIKNKAKMPYFIGHQANRLMLETVCRRLEIPEDRHLTNVEEFGNCSAAGAPSLVSQNWDLFKNGDEIILSVVGSGLAWGGILIRIEE